MKQYDQLKNKLHNYKVEIDKEKLWAKTSHAIPQRKRRRGVLIMLFGGLVICAWLLKSTSFDPMIERTLSHNENSSSSGQLAQNLQDNTLENPNEWKDTPNKTIEILSSKFSRSVATFTKSINPQAEESFSTLITGGENTLLTIKSNQIGNTQTLSESNIKARSDNSIHIHSNYENENIHSEKVHLVEFIFPEQKEGSFDNMHQAVFNFNNTDRTINLPVDYLTQDVLQLAIPIYSMSAINSHTPNIKPLKGRFLQSLQMVQGIGFSTVKIHSLTPESDHYAAQLEQKLRSLEVLSTFATATINLPGRFPLASGVQFMQLSTVIDHEWESNERIQEEGVATIIIDEHGIPHSITGSRDVTRTTHYQVKRFTTHQNIDFVLALHRVILNERRLSLDAFVKGAYNLSYDAKGTILDNNGELVSFSKEENLFRKDSPFAIGGGLQMRYQLNPHWSLTGNFTYDPLRYQFNNENLHVRFLHSGVTLGLGLAYIF